MANPVDVVVSHLSWKDFDYIPNINNVIDEQKVRFLETKTAGDEIGPTRTFANKFTYARAYLVAMKERIHTRRRPTE